MTITSYCPYVQLSVSVGDRKEVEDTVHGGEKVDCYGSGYGLMELHVM